MPLDPMEENTWQFPNTWCKVNNQNDKKDKSKNIGANPKWKVQPFFLPISFLTQYDFAGSFLVNQRCQGFYQVEDAWRHWSWQLLFDAKWYPMFLLLKPVSIPGVIIMPAANNAFLQGKIPQDLSKIGNFMIPASIRDWYIGIQSLALARNKSHRTFG